MTASRLLRIRSANVERRISPLPGFPLRIAGAHLWYAPLLELRPRLDDYAALLDDQERARALRFLHDVDRERFILGHGLLRTLLGHYLEQAPASLTLLRAEFGKPFIAHHPVHFNLSDTKDAVLIALANGPVGADIETMKRSTDHERVAEHYFTEPEIESIANASDGKRRFLELWTRKEAVLKASGVGLMDDLKSLDVGAADTTMVIKHPDFLRLTAPEYHVYTMHLGADHLVSLASPVTVSDIKVFGGDPG